MRVAVIGAGAYGCYLMDLLIQKFPDIKITLFEVGNSQIKNEDEIGYKTNLLNTHYSGLEKGRFFGFGGSTSKWGGQLLTFTKNDFKNPSPYLNDIIFLNEKYKKEVFKKFSINKSFKESNLTDRLFTKQGVWLGYFHRNLYKYFKIGKRKNIIIKANSRVVKLVIESNRKINKIIYKHNNEEMEESFDHYFLAAGAFESNRILMYSGLLQKKEMTFSDHLSQKVFKIKGSTKIGSEDFAFKIKGTSLITKRIIGEINGVSFFANPIFNSEFPFFQNLKRILFKKEIGLSIIRDVMRDIPSCLAFVWHMLVKKRMYVYKGQWYLYIDIENPINKSKISLAENKDDFNEIALNINYFIEDNVSVIYEQAKNIIKDYLIANKVIFEECNSTIQVEKSEDTYHPYGIMSNFESIEDYYSQYQNLLIVNTGILPRAGGINTTAAVFPLIEEYINNYMN